MSTHVMRDCALLRPKGRPTARLTPLPGRTNQPVLRQARQKGHKRPAISCEAKSGGTLNSHAAPQALEVTGTAEAVVAPVTNGVAPAPPVPEVKVQGNGQTKEEPKQLGRELKRVESIWEQTSTDFTEWDKVSTDDIEAWEGAPKTPYLDQVEFPYDLKNFSVNELKALCKELRADIIHAVSKTGGHLGSSLGVAELTVALHYVFNAPFDKIIWDVGHQAYGHKILTGRREGMDRIRQRPGLSGFTKRSESKYDCFGAGHSSTSISAALGMAIGRDFKGLNNHAIAVIGDGAITGGMAYEAINHAGFLKADKLIIILNDNQQVSLPTDFNGAKKPPVGALSRTLSFWQANKSQREFREIAKSVSNPAADPVTAITQRIEDLDDAIVASADQKPPRSVFEGLGMTYIGPIDGHDLGGLVNTLQNVQASSTEGPWLIHIITEKGMGYDPAENSLDRMHGVGKYDVISGAPIPSPTPAKAQSYTNFFADSLIAEAEEDNKIIAIHAAMGGGTGLNRFAKRFEERTFDVGIAEQHAVTFAAGLATEGMKPFCAIYSTFLQRAFDQVVHDVALQNLPVRFAIDRGGLVGADGATHGGFADVTFMACVPNMVVMAPSNEAELCHAVATAASINDRPSCFRFPRGDGIGVDLEAAGVKENLKGTPWEIGKALVRQQGKDVALLGYGTMVNQCLEAAKILAGKGISAEVVDMRFCKPLDTELVERVATDFPVVITVEENAIGGFGSHVLNHLVKKGLLDKGLKFRSMFLPDKFVDHGTQQQQLEEVGLTSQAIAELADTLLQPEKPVVFQKNEDASKANNPYTSPAASGNGQKDYAIN